MGEQQGRPTYKVLSTRTIVWFGVVLVVVGAGVAAALLWAYGAGTEADKARLDAIKTAGTIVVGTGGAAALWLAARRQQAAEIALRQKDIDQAHQEQDAAERRVTELYTKAVEQLGSEKAPVRLGGMYALERLAQNVPNQRQTIINVLCSYLRMPYQSPVAPDPVSTVSTAVSALIVSQQLDKQAAGEQAGPKVDRAENERRIQEREVRLTAQRIITKHLHPGDDADHPSETFWENLDLDLTGAILVAPDFGNCSVRTAQFGGVTFEGLALFSGARFEGDTGFGGATFEGRAEFGTATFKENVRFSQVTFEEDAEFGGATFEGDTGFGGATFEGRAWFGGATFKGSAWFGEATFKGDAWFGGATFEGHLRVLFGGATFKGDVRFNRATFKGGAMFDQVTFERGVEFGGAEFKGDVAVFTGARVRLVIPEPHRNWPQGFSLARPTSPQEAVLKGRDGMWGYVKVAGPESRK